LSVPSGWQFEARLHHHLGVGNRGHNNLVGLLSIRTETFSRDELVPNQGL
jgi:hypothetical protein